MSGHSLHGVRYSEATQFCVSIVSSPLIQRGEGTKLYLDKKEKVGRLEKQPEHSDEKDVVFVCSTSSQFMRLVEPDQLWNAQGAAVANISFPFAPDNYLCFWHLNARLK